MADIPEHQRFYSALLKLVISAKGELCLSEYGEFLDAAEGLIEDCKEVIREAREQRDRQDRPD